MSPKEGCIVVHRVRTDTLLWALGGFADPSPEASFQTAIPYATRQAIIEASHVPRVPYGTRKALAKRYGMSDRSIGVLMVRCRNGTIARYWRETSF